MRKVYGALAAIGLLLLYMLPSGARADAARDSLVNPGNAQHLGDSTRAGDSGKAAKAKEQAKKSEEKQEKAAPPNTEGRETHPGEGLPPAGTTETATAAADAPAGEAPPDSEAAPEEPAPGGDEVPVEDGGGGGSCGRCAPRCGTLEFYGPIAVVNQGPTNLLFLSPSPEAATVLERGRSFFKLRLDETNIIIREQDSGTITDFDFETTRLGAEYHAGLGRGEASVKLPYYYRGHGFLDHIIYEWHNFFGMPNGLRTRFPDQQYRYTIITQQGVVFNDEGDDKGLGDLTLGYKYPLWNRGDGEDAAAVRALLKLPTGDPDQAFGSGSTDYGVGVLYQRQLRPHLRAYANVDWVFVGAPDWPNIRQQDMLISNWIAEYALSHRTTLLAQYRTNRNPLRIGSTQADKDAQELTVGFSHRLEHGVVWSGGFVEDINPETAPDWTMTTDFKWEF